MPDDPKPAHLDEWTPSQKPHKPWMCQAHRTSDGERCRKPAIKGGNVCATHGGSAPQVKAKAMQRLQDASDRMAGVITDIADDPDVKPGIRLNAAREVLERAGVGQKFIDKEQESKPASMPRVQIGIFGKPADAIDTVAVKVIDAPQDEDAS